MTEIKQRFLNNKVIVITGGAGLIGRAFVTALLYQGATVVVADNNQDSLDAITKEFGTETESRKLFSCLLDITSKASIRELIAYSEKSIGEIDGLVNNAYPKNINYGRKFQDVEYSDFCESVSMHLGGYFLTTQQFAIYFEKKGRGNIINISSIYGFLAPRFKIYEGTEMTMPIEYAAIKSAIIHLTRYMAQCLKGKNIRVNCISPGGILNNQPSNFIDAYNSFAAGKGMLEPKDIGGTLIYLLSDLSEYVNGQNIVVDDGWSL